MPTIMTKNQHGGHRIPGPGKTLGRSKTLVNRVSISVTLEQKHIDWLKTQAPSVSEAIRNLVDERIEQ